MFPPTFCLNQWWPQSMVSKTWCDFIENDGGLWNNLMRKRFEDVQKNHETLRLAGCFSHDWRRD